MEAPDKIILSQDKESGIINDYWVIHDYTTTNNKIEYIRKEVLLKYLRNEFAIVDFHLKAQDDPVWWGQRNLFLGQCNAFQQVIDKIESL